MPLLWAILKWAGGKLLLPALLLCAAYFVGKHAGTLAERMAWQTKAAQAQLAALNAKDAQERKDATITRRQSDEIENARDAGRADALRYVASLRQPAAIHDDMPASSYTPGASVAASEATILDDATACADNTVKAEGWQAWWTAISNNQGE